MKKINFLLLGAAGLIMTSCSQDDVFSASSSDEANVTLSLSMPQLSTRSYSAGLTAKNLQYAVYKVKDNGDDSKTLTHLDMNGTGTMNNLEEQVSFKLVTNHTYGFVFWADSGTTPYSITFGQDGATLSVDYGAGKAVANDEKLDAFYAYHEMVVTGDAVETVYLTRPFAQINVGTSDWDDAAKAGYTPTVSHIKVKGGVYDTMDLVTGEVSCSDATVTSLDHDYEFAAIPTTETFPKIGDGSVPYKYLSMAYVLVPAEKEVIEVEFCVKDANDEHAAEHTVGSVPLQRNYRTNIYGQLITSNVDVNVIIEPNYEDPDYVIEHDGVKYDAATDTYTITNAQGLQWLSARVNAHDGKHNVSTKKPEGSTYGNYKYSFTGQTVKLGADIDMTGVDFQPIGYFVTSSDPSLYAFAGTFDGDGHTISNLNVVEDERNYNAGFFGFIAKATIKNLTLKDININGHYKVGGLVADAYLSDIENCTVSGGTITTTPWEKKPGIWDDGNNAGGLIGYLNVQPTTATIKNNKVENLEIKAFRTIGGLIGGMSVRDDINPHTAGITITGNTVSNVSLTADMTEVRYDKYAEREPKIDELYGNRGIESYVDDSNVQTDGFDNVTIVTIKPNSVVGSADELVEAVKNAKDGDMIYLKAGENYSLRTITWPKSGTITLMGQGADVTKVDMVRSDAYPAFNTPIKLVLSGMTIKTGNSTYNGIQVNELICEDVVFDGFTRGYSPKETYNNCTFTGLAGNSAYTSWGCHDVTFSNCTIDNTKGKGILIYHQASDCEINVQVDGCNFLVTSDYVADRGAIEIHTELMTNVKGNLVINNTTFPADKFFGLWNEVNNNDKSKTNFFDVTVDGKVEQTTE